MKFRMQSTAFTFAAGVAASVLLIPLWAQNPNPRALATFPAQQRPPGDPALIAGGKRLYTVNCQGCHGVDLRGGDMGGPNLLRSQVVLSDNEGELIAPILAGSRANLGMPAVSMSPEDVKALATYIHDVISSAKAQGAPPDAGVPVKSILVGDPAAGKKYFDEKCATCHSVTGDLQGIATKYADPKTLQNRWVGAAAGGRGGNSDRRTVTVTIAGPNGEKTEGKLVRIDDFLVSVALADGTIRTFRRDGATPKVEIHDPMQAHRDLLASCTDKDMHDVTAYLVTLK